MLAKQIVDNPLWEEFFETVEQSLIKSWADSQSPEYREDTWRYMQVLRRLKRYVETILQTGQMAEMAIAEMQGGEDGRKH